MGGTKSEIHGSSWAARQGLDGEKMGSNSEVVSGKGLARYIWAIMLASDPVSHA